MYVFVFACGGVLVMGELVFVFVCVWGGGCVCVCVCVLHKTMQGQMYWSLQTGHFS